MIANIHCNTCGKKLVNTDFWCSLECAMKDPYWQSEPDEKRQEVEQANQDLIYQ